MGGFGRLRATSGTAPASARQCRARGSMHGSTADFLCARALRRNLDSGGAAATQAYARRRPNAVARTAAQAAAAPRAVHKADPSSCGGPLKRRGWHAPCRCIGSLCHTTSACGRTHARPFDRAERAQECAACRATCARPVSAATHNKTGPVRGTTIATLLAACAIGPTPGFSRARR